MASQFAGIDLCQFPAGIPPDGQHVDFVNPPSLAPVLIAVCVIMTTLTVVFTTGRLYANFRKLSWSDYLVVTACVLSFANTGLMLAQTSYARHQWDVPACWYNGHYTKILFSQEIVLSFVLFFAKASLLVLLHQIFGVQTGVRLAIRIGMIAAFLLYFPTIPIAAIFSAPHIGKSWDDVLFDGGPQRSLYWGVVQAALSMALDLYLFALPLPVISSLNLSSRRRMQVLAVFMTAFLGVVASILSLVFRIQAMNTDDGTWKYTSLLICSVVEVDVAIMVSSMPGFAVFTRVHVAEWPLVKSLRSTLSEITRRDQESNSSGNGESGDKLSPNRLHTSRDKTMSTWPKRSQTYIELDDSWVVRGGATAMVQTEQPSAVLSSAGLGAGQVEQRPDAAIVRTLAVEQAVTYTTAPSAENLLPPGSWSGQKSW